MSKLSRACAAAGALLIAASSVSGVLASSHREAPLISMDPEADSTDLYAFVDPVDPRTRRAGPTSGSSIQPSST
jgi:hypothetical protein